MVHFILYMELWNIPNDDLAVRLTEHLGKAWRVAAAAAASAFALSLLGSFMERQFGFGR